jgi:Family of unknown function (DUF5681)
MSDDDARDERGRWKKGFCPNRKGRPRKKPPISEADINYFKNTQIEVTINKQPRQLTRHEVLLNAMYDKAIKGNVTMQRELFRRFEASDEIIAQAEMMVRDMERELVAKYRNKNEFDEVLHSKITELRALLAMGRQKPEG